MGIIFSKKLIIYLMKKGYIYINYKPCFNIYYKLQNFDIFQINFSLNLLKIHINFFFKFYTYKYPFWRLVSIRRKRRLLKKMNYLQLIKHKLFNIEFEYLSMSGVCLKEEFSNNHIFFFKSFLNINNIKELNWKYYY